MGYVLKVLASAYIALICLLVIRSFMCLFVQHDCMCRHVSSSRRLQRLHGRDMSCLSALFFSNSFPCFWYFNDWWM